MNVIRYVCWIRDTYSWLVSEAGSHWLCSSFISEEYNGSSWTATTAMNSVKANTAGQIKLLKHNHGFGGFGPGVLSNASYGMELVGLNLL